MVFLESFCFSFFMFACLLSERVVQGLNTPCFIQGAIRRYEKVGRGKVLLSPFFWNYWHLKLKRKWSEEKE